METFLLKTEQEEWNCSSTKNAKNGINGMTILQLRTERNGTKQNKNGTIEKRNENEAIELKALVLEQNGTISKKSERAQP